VTTKKRPFTIITNERINFRQILDAKYVCTRFVDLEKAYDWVPRENLLSSIPVARCRRPPVTSRQVTVFLFRSLSVSGELITTVHRKCWTPTRVRAVTTPFHRLHELDRQSQSSRRGCHSWEVQDQPFTLCGRFGTASIFSTGSSACPPSVFCSVRPSHVRKSALKTPIYYVSLENQGSICCN